MGIEELLSRLSALIPADAAWTEGGNEGRGNFRCENCVACEDCKFCRDCQQCRACTYCEGCEQCEGCTQCRRCIACADSSYLEDSRACCNSSYLLLCLDCEDSIHCLGCVGLSGAEFCILNEQVTRQAYFSQVRALRAEIEAMVDQGWRIDQLASSPICGGSPDLAAPAPVSASQPGSVECEPGPALTPDSPTGRVEAPPREPTQDESVSLPIEASESSEGASRSEGTESHAPTPEETHESRAPAPAPPSPEDVQRALAIEQEAQRLALDASRSFEARLARLQSPHPASPRSPSQDNKPPLWRSRIQGSAQTSLPSREDAAAHPALAAYRDLVPSDFGERNANPKQRPDQGIRIDPLVDQAPGSAPDRTSLSAPGRSPEPSSAPVPDFEPNASFAQAGISESLDWRRRERYRQAVVEQTAKPAVTPSGNAPTAHDQLRPRSLPNSRGPASWRSPRGSRDQDAGVQSPSSWVPRGALSERERQQKAASSTPSTPNRLLAFVKSGAAPLSKEEESPTPWTRAKLPPRKNR